MSELCSHLDEVALRQLVAARADRAGKGAGDRRCRQAGLFGMTGFLALEDGSVFRGESVAADGFAVDDERVRHQLGADAVHLGAFRPVQPMANDGAVAVI